MYAIGIITLCVLVVIFFGILWVGCHSYGVHNLFVRQKASKIGSVKWEDKGATPLGEKKYTPQGITWVDGKIIFANSWTNTKSRVYEIEPATMTGERYFEMPLEAVHTSGLAWDGQYLWAVDNVSNKSYCIDLQKSLAKSEIHLVGFFDTTLKGTSACCIVPWKGKKLLAISDFMNSRNTIFVDQVLALKKQTAENTIVFSYKNEGFSQGLEFFNNYLYESENKFGVDIINQIDLKKLVQFGYSAKATIHQYPAPSKGVEDLAWDGEYLWTSDESVFRFYKGMFLD